MTKNEIFLPLIEHCLKNEYTSDVWKYTTDIDFRHPSFVYEMVFKLTRDKYPSIKRIRIVQKCSHTMFIKHESIPFLKFFTRTVERKCILRKDYLDVSLTTTDVTNSCISLVYDIDEQLNGLIVNSIDRLVKERLVILNKEKLEELNVYKTIVKNTLPPQV